MKEVTKELVKNFRIYELGYDFMGYTLRKDNINYHHLIIPARKNGPQTDWNGCILMRNSSHDYLHIIEKYENEMFYQITSEMIDMKNKGYLDIYNLRQIHDMLYYFEYMYKDKISKSGTDIVKKLYVSERVKL